MVDYGRSRDNVDAMGYIRLRILIGVSIALAACTTGSEPTTSTNAVPELGGRVVVLDDGGNIAVLDPDGSNRVDMTNDGSEVRYFQPVWSPVGATIAFGRSTSRGASIGFVNDDGSGFRQVELPQFPFYFYWSPDGRRLGILHNGTTSGIDFEIVDVEEQTSAILDSGAPYYFSWSPDGDAVVVHADGNRLEIFDESANPTEVAAPSPDFLSPRWTSAGIFYLADSGVTLRRPGGDLTGLGSASGFVNINPNRDGSLVAINTLSDPVGVTVGLSAQEDLPAGAVVIVDTATGGTEVVSEVFALASFWSPDGEKLLILSLASSDGDTDLTIWEDGEISSVGTIRVSPTLVAEALQYSDQYAQSWQVWNPGSTAFVLPGEIQGDSGVWVIPTAGDPMRISDGTWAAWSNV